MHLEEQNLFSSIFKIKLSKYKQLICPLAYDIFQNLLGICPKFVKKSFDLSGVIW